jgi:hydrogenase nickel incorporation protein HypB
MCQDCGCGVVEQFTIHAHEGHQHHSSPNQRTITIKESILGKNDRLAERNRGYFLAKRVSVLNLLSSPGSGKTTLIEKTLTDLRDDCPTGVIVGDLETDNDARRLRNTGSPAIQITTGNVCHLEAEMVLSAAQKLDLDSLALVIIENVGNLVCPAAYDLGEDLRVVLVAVTEGEDKPLKYPTMFKSADVVMINKIDLAEVVGFDREKAMVNLTKVAPQAKILEVSARTGQGMDLWYSFLKEKIGNQVTLT